VPPPMSFLISEIGRATLVLPLPTEFLNKPFWSSTHLAHKTHFKFESTLNTLRAVIDRRKSVLLSRESTDLPHVSIRTQF